MTKKMPNAEWFWSFGPGALAQAIGIADMSMEDIRNGEFLARNGEPIGPKARADAGLLPIKKSK